MADQEREREQEDTLLKVLIRGGGGKDHDLLKVVGYLWLMEQKHDIVDFEAGGFDVLGVTLGKRPKYNAGPLAALGRRVVIDAKTSMTDLVAHFRKSIVEACDIEGKFSSCANKHYILARRGVLKPDAVHAPWGLLEYMDGKLEEAKEADFRAYVGEGDDLLDVAVRTSKLIATFLRHPDKLKMVKEELPEQTRRLLHDENKAQELVTLRCG